MGRVGVVIVGCRILSSSEYIRRDIGIMFIYFECSFILFSKLSF